MIHINKGTLTTFSTTLKEKRVNNSGTTVYYLINLNNDMTKKIGGLTVRKHILKGIHYLAYVTT